MISVQNPMAFFRKVVHELKGLDKADEWKVYIAVALLSMVVSFLFILYGAYTEDTVRQANGNQHIAISLGEPLRQSDIQANTEATKKKDEQFESGEAAAVPSQRRTDEETGEWYYDSVHKDWRYRK